jgi:hypothetical protein
MQKILLKVIFFKDSNMVQTQKPESNMVQTRNTLKHK